MLQQKRRSQCSGNLLKWLIIRCEASSETALFLFFETLGCGEDLGRKCESFRRPELRIMRNGTAAHCCGFSAILVSVELDVKHYTELFGAVTNPSYLLERAMP